MSLRLGWSGTNAQRDEFRLRFDDDLDRTIVDDLKIFGSRGGNIFDASSAPHSAYRDFVCTDGEKYRLSFTGLIPSHDDPQQDQKRPKSLDSLRHRLRSLSGSVQWLKGVRHQAKRLVPVTATHRPRMSPNGEEAATIALTVPGVLDAVNEFYHCDDVGRSLRSERAGGGLSRLFLDDPTSMNWRVELRDVGEGMSQVLPVLVALALSEHPLAPNIVALEDPDAHLHENAKKALAQHFASVVRKSNRDLRCVVETHSRTFLLGIQLAVARGDLKPEDVVIYWLDRQQNGASEPLVTFLDESGRPDNPVLQGALSEDETLVDQLLELQIGPRG